MTIYGQTNCRKTQRALTWLRDHQVNFTFHDFKKRGITAEKLQQWQAITDFNNFLNKKGSSWRKLDARSKARMVNSETALALMEEYPGNITGRHWKMKISYILDLMNRFMNACLQIARTNEK